MEKPTKILTAEEFDKLFSEKERFVRIACSYVNDIEAATDITTDGFMYLWEHRDKLDIDANIRGYIYNYIRTRCISFLRKRKSMLKAHSELYKKEQWRIESGINTLSNEELIGKLFESEIVEIYRRELAKMPMLTRNVFLASRLENMTYYQIAQKFNLTVRQVTSEIQRASLSKLNSYVFPVFFTPTSWTVGRSCPTSVSRGGVKTGVRIMLIPWSAAFFINVSTRYQYSSLNTGTL